MMLTPSQAEQHASANTTAGQCVSPTRPHASKPDRARPHRARRYTFTSGAFTCRPDGRSATAASHRLWVARRGLPRRSPLAVADFLLDGFPDVLLPLHAPSRAQTGCATETCCVANERCLAILLNDYNLRCMEGEILGVMSEGAAARAEPQHPQGGSEANGGGGWRWRWGWPWASHPPARADDEGARSTARAAAARPTRSAIAQIAHAPP